MIYKAKVSVAHRAGMRMKGGNMEVVRLGVKEPDVYRAFIACRGKMSKTGAKKYIEDEGFRVKEILNIELAEERYGCYIYYKGGK